MRSTLLAHLVSDSVVLILSLLSYQPDGVQRGLVGDIIGRFEKRGFKLIALKLVHATPQHLEKRTFFLLIVVECNLTDQAPDFRLRRSQGKTLLPWFDQVHGCRTRRRYGLGGFGRRQDGPCDARCYKSPFLEPWSVTYCNGSLASRAYWLEYRHHSW